MLKEIEYYWSNKTSPTIRKILQPIQFALNFPEFYPLSSKKQNRNQIFGSQHSPSPHTQKKLMLSYLFSPFLSAQNFLWENRKKGWRNEREKMTETNYTRSKSNLMQYEWRG